VSRTGFLSAQRATDLAQSYDFGRIPHFQFLNQYTRRPESGLPRPAFEIAGTARFSTRALPAEPWAGRRSGNLVCSRFILPVIGPTGDRTLRRGCSRFT
jgi:hypothetical protein